MLTERLLSIFRKEGGPVSNGARVGRVPFGQRHALSSRVRIGKPQIHKKGAA